MAYAQWLSELQQQASQSRNSQRAELDVLRDSIAAQGGELAEFKRHSMTVVQHLQNQVAELRERVAELVEMKPRAARDLYGFGGASDGGSPPARSILRDEGHRPQGTVQQQISTLIAALNSVQEQTLMKFGEVDQAMNILHANCAAMQQNMQAVDKISQDLRKEVADFGEKSASEMDHLKELRKVEAERLHRTEVQIATLQKNMQSASNKIAALSSSRGVSPLGRGTSPQRRAATPSQPAEEKDGAVYSHLLSLLDEQEQVRHKIGRFPRLPPN